MDILTKHDIIFLSESWTNDRSNIELNGYVSHNFYRKFQHKNARRNSGGIVLLYKKSLEPGIKIVRNNHDTLIWIKLDKQFFKFDEDLYLCGVYMWGENSPISQITGIDLFQTLQDDIFYFEKLGTVIIGDFNGRVSNKLDYVQYDANIRNVDSFDYNPDVPLPRASVDKVSNSQGTQLLDLCKSTSMKIGNGRLDDGQNLTYYSRTGTSVIDYLLLKFESFHIVGQFKVLAFNEFSDHAPLQFSLRAPPVNNDDDNFMHTSFKYIWNNEQRDMFRRKLISKLPDFNRICENVNRRDRRSVNGAVCDFVNVINDAASPLFRKCANIQQNVHNRVNRATRAKWFDNECREKKSVYVDALKTFNLDKSAENRQNLCDKKSAYKNLIRRKRRMYEFGKMKEIENLRHKKPKEFWRLFRKSKPSTGSNITTEEFCSYFKNLAQEINIVNNEEAESFDSNNDFNRPDPVYEELDVPITTEEFCSYFKNLAQEINIVNNEEAESFDSNNDFNRPDPVYEELDVPITTEEVRKCISALKGGKACGSDNLLNEYFIEAGDILLSHITDLFNIILDSGYFPDNWAEGIIIPLFKKGNENDVNNFRGITLVTCVSKLFTAVLNNRINNWSEKYTKVSDAQFGFRKGFSTVDAVYTLHSLIQHFLNNGKRLYCAFVDLKKAFDSVYRKALWLKLYKLGLNGKLLRIIRAMYDKVKCCVRHCNSYSDFFDISVGLKQGETLSPILFSLFLEDLELYLQSRPDSGLCLNDINIMLLLFADDMVLLGDTPEDLQNSWDKLQEYCQKWGLEVNVLKTKIVVLEKED